MVGFASQVAPSMDELPHETLIEENYFFPQPVSWQSLISIVHTHNKDYLSGSYSLMILQMLDHPHTSSTMRCERLDRLLLIVIATLTHMPLFTTLCKFLLGTTYIGLRFPLLINIITSFMGHTFKKTQSSNWNTNFLLLTFAKHFSRLLVIFSQSQLSCHFPIA